MNYAVKWSSRFKKQYKLMMKRGENMELLDNVIRMLAAGKTLPPEYVKDKTSSDKTRKRCYI